MYKILALNKISSTGTDCLPKDKYEILSEEANPVGILLRSYDMHEYDLPDSLLAAARAGAGVNNVPLDKCADKGVVVFNTPGANANAVKELVIWGLLSSSRKVVQGINWAQSLKGQDDVAKLVEKGKGDFVGPEIMGKTLGLIGLGAIGALVANAATALGMTVIGYDPFLSPEAAAKLPGVKIINDIPAVLAESDYVSLHLPLNKDTKYMFNEEMLNKAKAGIRVLNFARGELVCNEGIKKCLASGQVSSYVIDFPNGEVLDHENIITIPHLGASSPESEENCAYMAATQLKEYLENGNIINSVNYPNCELACTGKKRICVLSKNACPDALKAAITGAGHAVAGSVAKDRGGFAYAIFEVDGDIKDLSAVEKVEGVIKVRAI